jgi:hypothetical protein
VSPTFELTDVHLRLARGMVMGWSWHYTTPGGAPSVDPIRPYGTLDTLGDVMRLAGWPPEETDLRKYPYHRAAALHVEMETALQIVLCHAGEAVTPGVYRLRDRTDPRSWEREGGDGADDGDRVD